jgi:hypothetical protein
MKRIVIIACIILLVLSTGCIYVNPLVQAGDNNGSIDQTTAIQVCQIACDNHIQYLPLGCICPETPTPVKVTITPASAEK